MKVNFITISLSLVALVVIIYLISRKTKEGMIDLVSVTNKGVVDVNKMLNDVNNRNNLSVSDYVLQSHTVDSNSLIPFNPSLGNTNQTNNMGIQGVMNSPVASVQPNMSGNVKNMQSGSIQKQTQNNNMEGSETKKVSCGGHESDKCGNCPYEYDKDGNIIKDNGASWCNGDCAWEEASKKCVKKGSETKKVSCGGHESDKCGNCPYEYDKDGNIIKDNGASWCNGDCAWEEASKKCVKKGSVKPPAEKDNEKPKSEEVSCGGHKAKDCESCPQGNGAAWCNGDCVWEEASKKCVKKGSVTPSVPAPEPQTPQEPEPQISSFTELKEAISKSPQGIKIGLKSGHNENNFIDYTIGKHRDGTSYYLQKGGKYCAVEDNNVVNCNRNGDGPWERFSLESSNGNSVKSVKTGKYCAFENGDKIVCNRDRVGSWEKLTLRN